MKKGSYWLKIFVVVFVALALSGCTFIFQKGRRSDMQKIEELTRKLDDLDEAKRVLEERLGQEIKDDQVRLQRMDKGLVITFVADILFDSGKAELRSAALPTLDKVATVLRENVPDLNVGIEGHTDNEPIKHSGWKSNWELSAHRALSVLHHLAGDKGIASTRLCALAYGEFQPVASNDTKQGRQLNRRVEIVILPKVAKVKEGESGAQTPANLK